MGESFAPLLVGGTALFAVLNASAILGEINKLFESTQKIEGITQDIKEANQKIEKAVLVIKKVVLDLQENAKEKSSEGIANSIPPGATPEQIKEKLESNLSEGGKKSRPWKMYMEQNSIEKVAEAFRNDLADKATLQNKIFQNITIPEREW